MAFSNLGSSCGPIEEPDQENPDGLSPAAISGVRAVFDDLATAEPLCIFIYPKRTEILFRSKQQVVADHADTPEGRLARAKKLARELRDLGLRVSVYHGINWSHDRVFVEIGQPTEDGKRGAKQTHLFNTERDAVKFLRGARDDLAKAGER